MTNCGTRSGPIGVSRLGRAAFVRVSPSGFAKCIGQKMNGPPLCSLMKSRVLTGWPTNSKTR